MQVASNPYSSIPHSHYHSYYQLHPPGPQDYELKRQYLALLPPQQIIEICLTFDIHVPPYVKSSIWPLDISAAIAGLKKASDTQTVTAKPAEEIPKDAEAVMDSLKSPAPPESTPVVQEPVSTEEPQPSAKESTSAPPETSVSTEPSENLPTTSLPQTTESVSSTRTESSQPALTTQPTQTTQHTAATLPTPTIPPAPTESAPVTQPIPPIQPASATQPPLTTQPVSAVQPHYPHQPYGYAQAAYPISPYYAQAAGAYPYSYGAYASHYHAQAPAAYPPQPVPMYPVPAPPPQPQQEGTANDDLPGYEEMIVEALAACSDPDGLAPKDIYTSMLQRYPLHPTFRPSAGQALRKAYERGRFEKSGSGKYRLNPNWEGGTTTRRTTRRPQPHNSQSTPNNSTPAPPFTHAPLVHPSQNASTQSATQSAYLAQPYGYPYYPGFPAQPQSSTSTASAATAATSASNKMTSGIADADTDSDAYEAAQNILKAINFGNMLQLPPEEQQGAQGDKSADVQQAPGDANNGVEQLLSHVQAILASNAANEAANSGSAVAAAPAMAPSQSQVAADGSVQDSRAELQAQLALLAAQLAELAQVEDSIPVPPAQAAPVYSAPEPEPISATQPTPSDILEAVPILAPTPVIAASTVSISAISDTSDKMSDPLPVDDSDDDDDMEEVI